MTVGNRVAKRKKQNQPDFKKRQIVALLVIFTVVGATTMFLRSNLNPAPDASIQALPKPSKSPTPEPSESDLPVEPSYSPSPEFTYADSFIVPVVVAGVQTCANKESGLIRQVTESEPVCKENEFDLGNASIDPGDERPSELDPGLMQRFYAVQVAAKKSANFDLEITSGWRSLEYQQQLFDNSIKKNGSREEAMKWVALPEVSMHPWGTAIDINYTPDGREEASWVERHGYLYGLCRAYENEWWHFEPLVAPGGKCPKMRKDANVGYTETSQTPEPKP